WSASCCSGCSTEHLVHRHECYCETSGERVLDRSAGFVPIAGIETLPWQGRHELAAAEARRRGLLLAALEQQAAEAAPGVYGIDEKGADLRCICGRIEPRIVTLAARIAAEKRTTAAPAAASDNALIEVQHHEVGPIADE